MRIFLKILKWAGLLLLLAIAALISLPWLPVLKDQLGAKPYKNWLAAEMQPLETSDQDLGIELPDAVGDARFVMLSEIHGYAAVQKVDMALLRYLNDVHGVRTYLAELNPAQAIAFNTYIDGGSDAAARGVFDDWAAKNAQWGNREFFNKLTLIRGLNSTLPESRRVRFVGVDQPSGAGADSLGLGDASDSAPGFGSASAVRALNEMLAADNAQRVADDPDTVRYTHFLANIEKVSAIEGGEAELFYGLWGLFHGSKVTINGRKPLALRLNAPGAPFEGGVVSIVTMCIDGCFNMMPATATPPFFQPKSGEQYVLMPMNYDSVYLNRARGIGEIKSAMGDARLALVPLGADGSPYRSGPRLSEVSGYVAGMTAFDFGGSAGEAYDYAVIMRGSAALSPWSGQAHDPTGGNAAKAGID